ncbi:MAG: class I SAM-dependent methyltransferase [Solirubrobacteraceae bacterium]|nr:class I SAM-dependent methyltransferase [Solirubrobacteraceae bacterium]
MATRSHSDLSDTTPLTAARPGIAAPATTRPVGVAAKVERLLGDLSPGLAARPFTLRFWDGSQLLPTEDDGQPPLTIVIGRDALGHLLHRPDSLGLIRAWITGAIDLEGDFEQALLLRNRYGGLTIDRRTKLRALGQAARIGGWRLLRRPAIPESEAKVGGGLHSLGRDREAITFHYDVSNRFYEIQLGPSMVYSCAVFADSDESLEAAQERKLHRICQKLRLKEGERLLDIGCGWGSLLIHAAQHYGVQGVGVTISDAQAELARERIRDAGLADRLEVRVADYRTVDDGPYDKVVSVGMSEHVGSEQMGTYLAQLRQLVRPGGLVLNHAIGRLYSNAGGPDSFTSRYVFPDGELLRLGDLVARMEHAGLEVRDVESLREHYALTLRAWLKNMAAQRSEVIAAIGEQRERVWRAHHAGAAQGFESGGITIHQVLMVRPDEAHELPPVRAL